MHTLSYPMSAALSHSETHTPKTDANIKHVIVEINGVKK